MNKKEKRMGNKIIVWEWGGGNKFYFSFFIICSYKKDYPIMNPIPFEIPMSQLKVT